MGSIISLSAGAMDIDYGSNGSFALHGYLYQLGDQSVGPYYYADGIVEQKECLCRPLHRIKPRLELMGYSMEFCRRDVMKWLHAEYDAEDDDDDAPPEPDFEAFRRALLSLPWIEYRGYVDFANAIRNAYCDETRFSRGRVGAFLADNENSLDPYVVLRLLAEEPRFQELPVRWNYADVLEGEWTTEEMVSPAAPSTWIVVTEGSSDTTILKRSLPVLFPDVADFFEFIDMKDGYPFAGVGNIVNFCRGLSRIRYSGSMLMVLDNDTAGREALRQIDRIAKDSRVRATCLPDLEEFRSFPVLGPSGAGKEDINGRAGAIECYLDFGAAPSEGPIVRWNTFVEAMNAYQGELINKRRYQDDFRDRFGKDPNYDDSKLKRVWSHLIQQCLR